MDRARSSPPSCARRRGTHGVHPHPVSEAYPPAAIRVSVEESLRALGVERLDIVHLHQWWRPWIDNLSWLETLHALREEGKLRLIAVSVQDHEHDAALELVSRGLVDGLQAIVHLFESRPANALLPLAADRGVGVIARCALDSGGLSGVLDAEGFARRPFLKNAPYAEYAARIADSSAGQPLPSAAASLPELALRFVASLPGVSAITLGMNETRFVQAALADLAKGPLPDEVVTAIRREHVWTRNFLQAAPLGDEARKRNTVLPVEVGDQARAGCGHLGANCRTPVVVPSSRECPIAAVAGGLTMKC